MYKGYHKITYKSYYFNGTIDPFLAYAKMDRIIAKFIEKHENRFFTFFITQSHKNYTRIYRGYHTITYKSYYFNGTIDPFLAYAKMDRIIARNTKADF